MADAPGIRDNVGTGRTHDGKRRSHIPPLTPGELTLRILQAILAVIFIVLTSFSAYTLNWGNLDGFALSFFVFSLTAAYFIWYLISVTAYPVAYHWIAHIILEALVTIFWLAAWAVLASYASALNLAGAGRSRVVVVDKRQPAQTDGLSFASSSFPPSSAASSPYATATVPPAPADVLDAPSGDTIRAALIIIGVSAGLGALIWVLFVVTLIATSVAVARLQKRRRNRGESGV